MPRRMSRANRMSGSRDAGRSLVSQSNWVCLNRVEQSGFSLRACPSMRMCHHTFQFGTDSHYVWTEMQLVSPDQISLLDL